MKKILKYGLLSLLVVAMAVALVGCGGSKPTQEAAKEQPKDTAKAKLVVGSEPTFAPFEFTDPATGKFTGFDYDLMNALCEEAGYQMEFKSFAFSGLVAGVQSGQLDAAASAMSITDERKKSVNFTDPYYTSGLIVAVQSKNNDIKSIEDLKGKKIAVQLGTTGADKAKEIAGAKVTPFDTNDQAFMQLKNGNADAVINDYPVVMYFINQGNNDVKTVGEKLSAEDYGFAVPKNKPEVLDKLNAALKNLKENGKYNEIYKKWFGEEPKQ